MHEEFLPQTLEGKRDHIIEEIGEVLTHYGKLQRFGPNSFNPKLPPEERETNLEAFHRELDDLQWAIERYKWHRTDRYNRGENII